MIKIGILSDTHLSGTNDLFREQVEACFHDVSVIMHAGDLTEISVLDSFNNREVHAVHGNMCSFSTCTALPRKKSVRVGSFNIGLIHRAGNSYDFEAHLLDEFDEVDCIVYGHTHKPICHRVGSVLFVNPGSFMSTSRYGSPGTYAILEVGEDSMRCNIHEVGAKLMKNLWTPWRMSYILGEKDDEGGCIFEADPQSTHSKKRHILYRDELVVVLMNRFPYANGHLLVAPARHISEITALELKENHSIMEMIQKSVTILKSHLKPDGFNIGLNLGEVAGAGLANHLHFHIVPRWEGDHNFMTVLSEVRTIPEHIANTFDQLLPDFEALQAR